MASKRAVEKAAWMVEMMVGMMVAWKDWLKAVLMVVAMAAMREFWLAARLVVELEYYSE